MILNDVPNRIAQLDDKCSVLKTQMSEETPEFSALLDEVCSGKEHKMSNLVKLVEMQGKLTATQQEYLFRRYGIERLTGVDTSTSVALAILILGNKNLTRRFIKRYAPNANSWMQERLEIIMDDALRRAIDAYKVEYGTAFSTYAFKSFYMAFVTMKPELDMVSSTTQVADNLTLEETIGESDDFFDNFSRKDYAQYVWKSLGYFNDRCQFIIMAYLGKYCEPMSYAEIGEILGISTSAVGHILREMIRTIGRCVKVESNEPTVRTGLSRKEYHLINSREFHNMFKAECKKNVGLTKIGG